MGKIWYNAYRIYWGFVPLQHKGEAMYENPAAVAAEEDTLAGIVDTIIYQNGENGYVVFGMEDTTGAMVTVTGVVPYLSEGDTITVRGQWTNHNVYGRQFKAVSYDKQLPAELSDILRYLSSGAVKGIGPKTAQKIVEQFGTDAFDVLENHADWLVDIPGITKKKAQDISENFKSIAGARSVMLFCRDFFPSATTMRIYKKWGGAAVDRIKDNPYSLCEHFNGISFRRADQIAAQLGMDPDSDERILHGLSHVLSTESQRNGHTCLPEDELVRCTVELLFNQNTAYVPQIRAQMDRAYAESRLVVVNRNGMRLVYLPHFYRAETYVAKKMKQLSQLSARMDTSDIPRMIEKSEAQCGIPYAKMQRQAISDALCDGVMILTGGPGTGKTTIIKGLLSIFASMDLQISLAAPTGRAAKRMSEATSHEAKTIHRLLEMDAADETGASFMRNEQNRLDEDVLIVDEASMIDVLLMEALLRAIKPGARLILIGDTDQLPSVGAGNVLGDICASGQFRVVRLTEVFRQSQQSYIITNAHRINEGQLPEPSKADGDFFFLKRQTEEAISATIVDLVQNRLPKTYGASVISQIQIITPSRKGMSGTETLNAGLQAALNPPAPGKSERKSRDIIFRVGDRVMQTKNDYTLEWETDGGKNGMGVFNGDIGVVTDIDDHAEAVEVTFDDRKCLYDYTQLDELDHAYAITVHKSQGSEYPVVIIPLFDCAAMLQSRNLLYTAVTRASRMVILVGKTSVLERMIANNHQAGRCSLLRDWLEDGESI